MPSYITPIQHTRNFALKPADGLRYGNFEGVVHLPPVVKTTKLGAHSFSTLNNQQIYKTVCEWYEAWRPWQQKLLLCGIVDRCSMRQVDMLATTLEPIRHRDYTVAAKHYYPTSPLKRIRDEPRERRKKKKKAKPKMVKVKKHHVEKLKVAEDSRGEYLEGAVSPESVIGPDPTYFTSPGKNVFEDKLAADAMDTDRSRDFTNSSRGYSSVDQYADVLATRIIGESIPKTVTLFEPSELYAQDLASSILQQAVDNVVEHMDEREQSIELKTEKVRLGAETAEFAADGDEIKKEVSVIDEGNEETEASKDGKAAVNKVIDEDEGNEETEASKDGKAGVERVTDKGDEVTKQEDAEKKSSGKGKTVVKHSSEGGTLSRQNVDMSVLDKYRKYKSPKPMNSLIRSDKPKRPKSLVRILVPDTDEDRHHEDTRRGGSGHSGMARSLSAMTRSSLSDIRYKLFGAHSIATPDFFKQNALSRLDGGMQHLRQGVVRRPVGVTNIPVPLARMYKNIKWWPEGSGEGGRIMFKAQHNELKANFKDQLKQVWEWMQLWEDFEKIALLKELLKLCEPEDLNFLCSHLQQKIRDARDINRMSDRLLLYIFSFLSENEIQCASRVCRRWRFLCATDDLWKVKCHELGLEQGIKNLEKMIVRSKGWRMVIDWRLAYEELHRITEMMKAGFKKKKKEKPTPKARTVEFKEQLELLKQRDENNNIKPTNTIPVPRLERKKSSASDSSCSSSSSCFSDNPSDTSDHPRFEFRNQIKLNMDATKKPLTRDELQSILKQMLFGPEGKQKAKPPSRGTPVIVELEVHRGTLSAIRRKERGVDDDDDDAKSVVSEDLTQYDEEYKIQWDTRPHSKPSKSHREPAQAIPTEGAVEAVSKSEDTFNRLKNWKTAGDKEAGLSILRRRKEMTDDATGDDAAFDIRPDLIPAQDILGKTKPHMSLQWQKVKKRKEEEEEEEEEDRYSGREPAFAGEVKSVLRARKLHGHMNGIMCLQFDHRRLLSAGLDRVIRMWDIRSGRSLHKFYGHKGGIRCLQFVGNELVTGSWDTTLMVWDLKNMCRRLILTDHSDSVNCLALDSNFLVSGSDDCTVRVWRRSSYLCGCVIRGHKAGITSLAFDGSHVVSASRDTTLRLSNILTGICVRVFTGGDEQVTTVTMKGGLIISGDMEGRVHFWNKQTAECEAAIKAHSESVNRVVFLEGRFYTAASDGCIREWDLVTMTSVRLLQGHKGPVRDLKVSTDRIVSCSDDGSIRIWDLFDPRKRESMEEQIHQLHHD